MGDTHRLAFHHIFVGLKLAPPHFAHFSPRPTSIGSRLESYDETLAFGEAIRRGFWIPSATMCAPSVQPEPSLRVRGGNLRATPYL